MIISLQSPLIRRAGFLHGFSTSALDLALDAPGHADRLARFTEAAGIAAAGGVWQLRQVHGARVVRVPGARAEGSVTAPEVAGEGDALVSDAVPVGVRVADCVPVLVGLLAERAPRGRAVAAIHAGWRGIVAGVIGAAMRELAGERVEGPVQAARGHVRSIVLQGGAVAAIGPCIGPCCFEVDAEVADRIADASGCPEAIARRAGAKAYVDLRAAARAELRRAGLRDADIDDVPGCTRCDESRFFSFRRDGARAGRHLAAIAPS